MRQKRLTRNTRFASLQELLFKTPVMIKTFIGIFGITCILIFSDAALAQSGRRGNQPPVAPSATPKPPVTEIKTPEKISSLVLAGEIVHNDPYFRSNYLGAALKDCANRLKELPRAMTNVTIVGRLKMSEAKERAKKETDSHLLWLGFETADTAMGEMYIEYVDYAVLLPKTGGMLTTGRVYPGKQNVLGRGGILNIPSLPTRSAALQMKQGAQEVVDVLKRGGWL